MIKQFSEDITKNYTYLYRASDPLDYHYRNKTYKHILNLYQKYIKKDTSEKNKTITLLKKIAASEKDVVEIKDFVLYINGEEKGKLLKLKGLTEKSPNFKKILLKDEFFLLGETSDSFDSRYFGIVKKQDLISEIKIFLKGKDIEKALWWLK